MKYQNPSVLTADRVEIGKSYLLAELPAGISFQLGRGNFKTMAPPKYNMVARNCAAAPAQVWNIIFGRIHRVAYRQRVKVVGKA